MKLATSADMRRLEQAAVDGGASLATLMEAAGLAVAREAWMLVGGVPGEAVVVLAGRGNNGGDGLVAARQLHDWGCHVRVFAPVGREADQLLEALAERGVEVESAADGAVQGQLAEALRDARLVIDAILGTGVTRPIAPDGPIGVCLRHVLRVRGEALGPGLLAVDIPSGLNPDTGAVDPVTVPADMTVTFGLAKVGLFQQPGAALAGTVEVADIGLPHADVSSVGQELIEERDAKGLLPARNLDANKGTFGRVLVVGGSRQFSGAIVLAARGAYRAGAGLVTIACPESIQASLVPAIPEATWLPQVATPDGTMADTAALDLRGAWGRAAAAIVGPGMTDSDPVRSLVWAALPDAGAVAGGVVIDADALNALATMPDAADRLPPRAVLTPHPGEMARLMATTVAAVQANRVAVAREAAGRFGCVVVVKGAGTVVAAPDGQVRIASFANPLLATAGTGDVLAGCIAGYLAQGLAPFDAASLGVYVHGRAAENLATRFGAAGMLAGELADALPAVARDLGE